MSFAASFSSGNPIKQGITNLFNFFTPRQQAQQITQGIKQPFQITGVKKKQWF